jgi:hypothetical protein
VSPSFSFSLSPPQAASKKGEKKFFGDTPIPGRGLAALCTPAFKRREISTIMEKRQKDIMRTLVRKLRSILVGTPSPTGFLPGSLDRELEHIGIASDGTITPADALLHTIQNRELRAYRIAVEVLTPLPEEQRPQARREIVERAAYTWVNRLLALRAMEVRQLIYSTLRGQQDYGGLSEKLYFLRLEDPQRAASADGGWWAVIEDVCNEQAKALPGLFDLADPDAALRPASAALIQCIELVNGSQPVDANITPEDLDATFADPDAIGWAYQFYQEEAKARINAKCNMGGKVENRSELVAKTELFTEPYMVQWLLQNSLGRSYHEINPQSRLPETWEYYIKPEKLETGARFDFASLTLLDPCMGSGHFLRMAFDMFVAMYQDLYPSLTAKEIADNILKTHLHGIDLDPRAAQLAGLTLYLRAWELVREEQRKARKRGSSVYIPPVKHMNLATTPKGLDKGALERHLQRVPQDKIFKTLLENMFTSLEQADILGSLLHTREYIDSAIAELLKPRNYELEFDSDIIMRHQAITEMAKFDPANLRNELFETIARSFKVEAGNIDDVSVALFGHEAERGVRLLQVLDRQYAVVVTNPPYLGSKYMSTLLKKYVEDHYSSGKRDLYAAFILRCLQLCHPNGRVAMVTMQSWMFLSSYAELRAWPEEKLAEDKNTVSFTGLLRKISIELLAHLGSNAFEEIGGEIVQNAMFVLANHISDREHKLVAFRLTGLKSVEEKITSLLKTKFSATNRVITKPKQYNFLAIPEAPISYYLSEELLSHLINGHRLKDIMAVRQGLATADNSRFTRCFWECSEFGRWVPYAKGGGYCKWTGLEWLLVDWQFDGARVRLFGKGVLRATEFYFKPGLTYTPVSGGALGLRRLNNSVFDVKGSSLFPKDKNQSLIGVAACLNTHVCSYFTRAISQSLELHVGYLSQVPIPNNLNMFYNLGNIAEKLKRSIVSANQTERDFKSTLSNDEELAISALLHTVEGVIERQVCTAYSLSSNALQAIISETGIPTGWYPLVTNYSTLPTLPNNIDLPALPQELFNYLEEHERISMDSEELARTKANLRMLYEAGPGAKSVELEENNGGMENSKTEEEMVSGAYIPIPTETFLEELSVKIGLHPISVYWLLEELRAEGARCKPEEKRLLEDRLSVLVLRLLGHRWPKQLEEEEAVLLWADEHGIIPLVPSMGNSTLAERVRDRLRREDGPLATQQTEALLQELTGQNLEQWLRQSFFASHVRQFKYRPIAWHLASKPAKGTKSTKSKQSITAISSGPAFECLLYYHACPKGALTRIRVQYIEPLLDAERNKVELRSTPDTTIGTDNTFKVDETKIAIAQARIRELEDFATRLQKIEEEGFAAPELPGLLAEEPLDLWSGDGQRKPSDYDEFRRSEEAWHVDINDGVRVNIAPLQLAGVLVSDVLKLADAKKAIADRARWRADERRWVREGKLPRCGWMDEQVPASQKWLAEEASRHAEENKPQPEQLALQQEGLEV